MGLPLQLAEIDPFTFMKSKMFWFFEKLNTIAARAAIWAFQWIVVPCVVMLLCLFRVKFPEYPNDDQSCLDQVEPKPDDQDAVALQDEMSGVRR